MNGWSDYLAIGAALQKAWPDVDVVGLDNGDLAGKLRSLPETDGFGPVPEKASFFFAVKAAWLKARQPAEADLPMDALL
jgi:Fe-S-cluster formation regulator IscX/YfhJ